MIASQPNAVPTRPVWSVGTRLLHWTLAISMIASFATHEGGGQVHEWTGYLALAAAALRVALGFFAGGMWRFATFVRGIRATAAYTRAVWQHREPHYLGHNPLGGWMVVALLADALAAGATGWLYVTDRFWGVQWLGELHGALGQVLIPLLLLHVAGVVFTSIRQRENLAAAMVHGRKRVPPESGGP
jgi:cytochrome b